MVYSEDTLETQQGDIHHEWVRVRLGELDHAMSSLASSSMSHTSKQKQFPPEIFLAIFEAI